MAFKVARSESLISGRVRVTFVSSSCIMPGTTIAIDCLRPIVPRILSAAAMAAGDAAAGGVVSAALADTFKAANTKTAKRPLARAGINDSWGAASISVWVAKHFNALGAGDDRCARKADEKPVFDDSGNR